MNAVPTQIGNEVDVANAEVTDTKIDALRDSLDEVKEDIREVRADLNSLRDKVDAGFTALRDEDGVPALSLPG